jgi:hypothetical protein
MKYVLVTRDPEVRQATDGAFQPDDEALMFEDWAPALEACDGADMIFVDMLATLDEPHRVAGYERFAHANMDHPVASATPLVLIALPDGYEMDFMAGFPDFVFAHLKRPVTFKVLRRATTWV